MDDWQLLQNYIERDSDAAFRTLVNRYVNLVYSVALRQVRDAHLAEEVVAPAGISAMSGSGFIGFRLP